MKGYCGKVMRVNLADRTMRVESRAENRTFMFLGGRGIAARYFFDEVGPEGAHARPEFETIGMFGPTAVSWTSGRL